MFDIIWEYWLLSRLWPPHSDNKALNSSLYLHVVIASNNWPINFLLHGFFFTIDSAHGLMHKSNSSMQGTHKSLLSYFIVLGHRWSSPSGDDQGLREFAGPGLFSYLVLQSLSWVDHHNSLNFYGHIFIDGWQLTLFELFVFCGSFQWYGLNATL